MKPLGSYFVRQIIERLGLKDNVLKLTSLLTGLMDSRNRANVADIHEALFPMSQPASANTQLNRLITEINKKAQDMNVALNVEITKDKKGGPKNRWVWFEGGLEAPALPYTGELNGVGASELIADQRGLPADECPTVVLITFNEHETAAVVKHFHPTGAPETKTVDGITYNLLGIHGGMRIAHRISKQGQGEAQNAAFDAISGWHPKAIIGVGIAFGTNKTKQKIGDVLVSESVRDYELGRIGPDGAIKPRGNKPPASDTLLQRFNHLNQIRCSDPNAPVFWPKIHFGTLLSGNKLVDNLDYRKSLMDIETEAIGGEMEATGIFNAAHRHKIDWIIVKAICDWGDGEKNNPNKENDQKTAADNAALIVKCALDEGNLYEGGGAPASSIAKSNRHHFPSVDCFNLKDHDAVSCLIHDVTASQTTLKKERFSHEPGETHQEGVDVMDYLMKWVNDDDAPPLFCLLGEYGMGKTITSQRLTKFLAEKRQQNPALPMPLYFDLRHVTGLDKGVPTIKQTIEECMDRGWHHDSAHANYTLDDIYDWMAQGAVVILDGLDEVLVKLKEADGQVFTGSLLKLGADARAQAAKNKQIAPPVKIMISCRTQYFRTLRDQQNHFTGQERGEHRAETYKALILLPLNENQIKTYLKNALPGSDPARIYEALESVHNLKELAHRPYTLRLVAEFIPGIEKERMTGKTIYGVTLYHHMVRLWLERDSGKHHIRVDHKLRLSAHLAARLWRSGSGRLPAADMEDWFHEWLESQPNLYRRYKSLHPDQLEEDLRTATFLAREDGKDGSAFRFSHTSLMEYFLADYLLEAMRENVPERWAMPRPSMETLDFMGQMMVEANDPGHTRTMRTWSRTYRVGVSELILDYALHARKKGWPVPNLSGMVLSGANLNDWDFDGRTNAGQKTNSLLDLSNVCFKGTNLRNARFDQVNLSHADFSGAILSHANVLSCDAIGTDFRNIECTAAIFRKTKLHDAIWKDATGHRPHFLLCDGLPDAEFLKTDTSLSVVQIVTASSWGKDMPDPKDLLKLSHLTGHNSIVWSCAFSPQGDRVVSGGDDSTVRLWDAKTGEMLMTLNGHDGGVNSCAFSPQGDRVVSAGDDSTVRLWDAKTGEMLMTLNGHDGGVTSCAFSPQGDRMVSAGYDRTVRLWDARTGGMLMTLNGHDGGVNSCAFSPQGDRVVSAGYDRIVRLWDAKTGEMLMTLNGHDGGVRSCAFSPQGDRVVSAGSDRTMRLWDAKTGEMLMTLNGHDGGINSCAFSPQGDRVVSAGYDRTVRIWDTKTGEMLMTLNGHDGGIFSCAFSPQGEDRVVSAGYDRTVRIWDAKTGEMLMTLNGHDGGINSCAFSPKGDRVVSAGYDSIVRLWDAKTGEMLMPLNGHDDWVASCAFSPQGDRVVSAGSDRTMRLWDAKTGEMLMTLNGHDDWVASCAFSPQGDRVVSAGYDSTVRLRDAKTGEMLMALNGHDGWVLSCAFSPQGDRVVSAGYDRTVRLWDAKTGEMLMTLNGHDGWVRSCAFSPQGDRVVSAGYDCTVRLWDAKTGEMLMTLNGHDGRVNSCAFSPQGDQVVSAGYDRTVRLWDSKTGRLLRIHAFTDLNSREPGHAVLDVETNHLIEACGDIWRNLAWVRRGPDGWPERLPIETFGPMPAPKRMNSRPGSSLQP